MQQLLRRHQGPVLRHRRGRAIILTGLLITVAALYAGAACAFFIGLHRNRLKNPARETPFISVVIAARNEADFIGPCLESLSRQTYPTDRFEILVADDDSEDSTAAIVEACARQMPNLRLLRTGNAFPEMAAKKRPMSAGIRQARGEWIATTDADCRAPATWLSALSVHMRPDVGAIIGFSHLSPAHRGLFQRLQALDFLALMAAAAGAAGLGIPLAASGQNLAYRKALFNQVGGFAAIAHRPSGDDVLLLQLLRRAWPGRIVFADDPGAFVSTHRAETPASFFRQRRRWASNAAYQIKLNPAFFAYISAVFLLNALILIGLFFATGPALTCYLVKTLCDLLVIGAGAHRFSRTDLLSALPLWILLQPLYTLLVGLFGTLSGFTWKGRRHG